jgi:DNA polymerase elongation subunit (family B)
MLLDLWGVHAVIKLKKGQFLMMKSEQKVLIWDIETSLMQVAVFQLKNDYINPDSILTDWHIISGAWKWLGEDKVYSAVNKKGDNDIKLVTKLADVLSKADVVVHHNGDRFDVKKLHTRMIKHGIMPTYANLRTVDTLKEAKKHFGFSSNRLMYIARFLGVTEKEHSESSFWMKELKGDHSSLKDMVTYNKGDVITLEEVYLKMLPYIDHPNMNLGVSDNCPNCGTSYTIKRGFGATRAGLTRQIHQCKMCFKYYSTKV